VCSEAAANVRFIFYFLLEKRRWREVEEEGRLLSEQKSEEKGTSLKEEGVVRRRSWLSIRGGQRHSITIVIWS